jgi:tRNA-splicing ligase RtcB
MTDWASVLQKQGDASWVIPRTYRPDMRVPGKIFASGKLYDLLVADEAPAQVVNVATLPGIVRWSLAMPDIHFGYGFPIGGVAAMDADQGVISPGGVGFDINCGVRMLRTDLGREDILEHSQNLGNQLFSNIPCGVGSHGDIRLSAKDMERVLCRGAAWAVSQGIGENSDLEFCEQNGCLETHDTDGVSARARERGKDQLGTLGSGNHFIEVQYVDAVYDENAARTMGLEHGLATIMIHSGSRGLGAQVCQDSVREMKAAVIKYGIDLPDRQLACAPVKSPEGQRYYGAMAGAANYAWANRQCMAHLVRRTFEEVFGLGAARLGLRQVYDVAHNIAKMEKHDVDGKQRTLCVHRKGATRAFPAGHAEIPAAYKSVGQPVIVPGDMGRYSYVLAGTDRAMSETWGSICHGAGRVQSRSAAKASYTSSQVIEKLRQRGVEIRARGKKTIVEEAPEAYKDVSLVVETCEKAGIATKVARLRPLIVIKG